MDLIELKSITGLTLVLSRRGAGIAALYAPDRNGALSNVCLRPDEDENTGTFSGATIAPVAGRVSGGAVSISGAAYCMPQNDGANCLHSGPGTLGRAVWDVVYRSGSEVRFQKALAHGGCGLPGNRVFTADYRLCGNCFSLELSAVSDRDTFVNMTNHAYWNLSGNWAADAYDHELQIFSDAVWYNDKDHLPQKLCRVQNSAFDYRLPRTIRSALGESAGADQLRNANGYNNAFALNGRPAVRLCHPGSGRRMIIETDAPCLIFYSGGYLPIAGSALAFEPQLVPDAPRLLGAKLPLLRKGAVFRTVSSYRFDAF
ncbi:hypothetical protein [Allofournierella sp.]|uniref:aldose epimerase family protein n=1 Tax=Allofournierella sp. TaxID=1940256 RepID=UPI003AB88500